MSSTALLIALAILIIAVIVYFAARKRNTLAWLQKLTGPPLPIMDRIVGEYVNLPLKSLCNVVETTNVLYVPKDVSKTLRLLRCLAKGRTSPCKRP